MTIAEQLRAAGYRTYLTGKWHLGKTRDTLPVAHGYDRSFALSQSGADNFAQKPNLLLYDKADWTEDGRPATLPKDYYSSRFIVERMIRYIDAGAASGKPFLASLNFLANHIPVQAPDADIPPIGTATPPAGRGCAPTAVPAPLPRASCPAAWRW